MYNLLIAALRLDITKVVLGFLNINLAILLLQLALAKGDNEVVIWTTLFCLTTKAITLYCHFNYLTW